MSGKAGYEKLEKTVLLSFTAAQFETLVVVAKDNGITIQELFRRAAGAITRCQLAHGEVPMDMELSQRPVGPGRHRFEGLLNEPPAPLPSKKRSA